MKTLIIFASRYGTTEKAAGSLKEYLDGDVAIVNVKDVKLIDITDYDTIVIGGSIYVGRIQKALEQFINKNLDILLTTRIGLFICCMQEGEAANSQLLSAYPNKLLEKAIATGIFGGEFLVSKMNFIERKIVKKVSGVINDQSNLNLTSIQSFAKTINQHPVMQ